MNLKRSYSAFASAQKFIEDGGYYYGANLERLYAKRNYSTVFGYPDLTDLRLFKRLYQRMPLAKGVVDMYVNHLWGEQPTIFSEQVPNLQEEFNVLAREMKLHSAMEGADRMALVGGNAFLLAISLPADISADPGNEQITQFKPYDLSYIEPTLDEAEVVKFYKNDNKKIHPHRIIDIKYSTWASAFWGSSIIEPILNAIYDNFKTLGSAAESVWRAAIDLSILHVSDSADQAEMEAFAKRFSQLTSGEERVLAMKGASVSRTQPATVQVGEILDKIKEEVSIATGIPKRILSGTEEGKLAGDADRERWEADLNSRRRRHAEPEIIVPIVKKLMATGQLPSADDFQIQWESKKSDQARLELESVRASTLERYARTLAMITDEGLRDEIEDLMSAASR